MQCLESTSSPSTALQAPRMYRIWGLTNTTHNVLLPLISGRLPLCDEIAKMVLSFSRSCLLSDNDSVRFLSRYSVWYGRMSSPFGSNVFHCCLRYCADVDDVWSVTPAYILQLCKPTDSELLSKARMLLELVFIRHGLFHI